MDREPATPSPDSRPIPISVRRFRAALLAAAAVSWTCAWGPRAHAPLASETATRAMSDVSAASPAWRESRIAPAAPQAAAASPPSIVMILTDDQDVQLGSLAYMPNVQSLLAQQGATFVNHYVPLSLCCPSRTTILRGQYPHNTGVLTNNLPDGGFEKAYAENLESATLATVLHGAGYRTVLLGKYLNGYPDTAPANYVPPGWDEWYSPSAGNPYSEYNYTMNENGHPVVYGATPADYLTDVIHAKAVDFIRRTAPTQPVFVYFATYAPHSPYTPAPRHASLFPNLKAPRPPSFNEPNVSSKPAYVQSRNILAQAEVDTIDGNYRDRIRALQAVDEAVADLVGTLASTGRLANSYVVFTSDNGYHMGEHRLPPGKYTPYETDLHVPLIIRGPGIPAGAVRDQFTGNLDLAETFADMAGVPPLPFSDGRSLTPLFSDRAPSNWRRAFLLEEFNQGDLNVVDPDKTDPMSPTGIREPLDPAQIGEAPLPIPTYYGFQAPGYKFIEYLVKATGTIAERELYLASDPFELRNRASQMDSTLIDSFEAYLNSLIHCSTTGCRSAEAVAPPPLTGAVASAGATPIPAGFFAMSSVTATDFPKVSIGTLGHLLLSWPVMEPSRGTFDFSRYDAYVASAQQHGLVDANNTASVAITLGMTPSWAVASQASCTRPVASSAQMQCTAPPDNIQDWKDFLTAVVQHYNGRTQPHLRYYELWNEFNDNAWWTGTDAQMVALAQAAYPIVHQDPYSILLTPSVAGPAGTGAGNSIVNAMTSYLKVGGAAFADGGAYHGYVAATGVTPFPMPEDEATSGCRPFVTCYGSVMNVAGQMRAVFDQNGLSGKPMFQTEGSWGNGNETDPDTQAAWLARYYLLQAGLRSTSNLQMASWFAWANPSFGWGDVATPSLQTTSAGVAYNQVYGWVVGATMTNPCSGAADGTWTCILTRSGDYVAQAVWNTQGTATFTPGAGYIQTRDLAGNVTPLAPGVSVAIGPKPILVEGRGSGVLFSPRKIGFR